MDGKVGFLFDNDGVLIDSSALHYLSWQLLAEEKGSSFRISKDAFVKGFGKRNDLILQENLPGVSAEIRKHLADRKEELFRDNAAGKIELLLGMEAFLAILKKKNIPRIIASSTPVENLEMFLKTTVLGKYFDAFVSGEEVPHGKPAPDIFIEGARRLNLPPSQCIVVEDAPAGIEAGKMAGCFVVALATTHPAESLSGYDLLYPTPFELNLDEILAAFAKKS